MEPWRGLPELDPLELTHVCEPLGTHLRGTFGLRPLEVSPWRAELRVSWMGPSLWDPLDGTAWWVSPGADSREGTPWRGLPGGDCLGDTLMGTPWRGSCSVPSGENPREVTLFRDPILGTPVRYSLERTPSDRPLEVTPWMGLP